jgi:hypothetical protein
LQILLDPLVAEDTEPYAAGRDIGSPIRGNSRLLHQQRGPSSKGDQMSITIGQPEPHHNPEANAKAPPSCLSDHQGLPTKPHGKSKLVQSLQEGVDWRSHLCRVLNVDLDSSDALLLETVRQMEKDLTRPAVKPRKADIYFNILHRIECKKDKSRFLYQDIPYFLNQNGEDDHLRGRRVVSNMELYVERNRGLSFIVFKHYICCNPDTKSKSGDEPTPVTESVYIISADLYSALKTVSRKSSQTYLYPNFQVGLELSAPYLWFYHDRSFITSTVGRFKSRRKRHLHCLFNDYISIHMGEEYAEVDKQLSAKLISSNFLSYIFVSAHSQS